MKQFISSLPLDLVNSEGKKYRIKLPIQSGGKAGKGHNKTSTIQVVYEGMMAVKQIRYTVRDHESKMAAIEKAIAYVVGPKTAKTYFHEI